MQYWQKSRSRDQLEHEINDRIHIMFWSFVGKIKEGTLTKIKLLLSQIYLLEEVLSLGTLSTYYSDFVANWIKDLKKQMIKIILLLLHYY